MLVFHCTIVTHFHFPGVFSINCNITNIFIFRERISKENIFFVCRLIWVLFIERLKNLNAETGNAETSNAELVMLKLVMLKLDPKTRNSNFSNVRYRAKHRNSA